MTTDDWDECDNPWVVLTFRHGPDEAHRRCRLFAVACCRWVWPSVRSERCRSAVEVAERFADGGATAAELYCARSDTGEVAARETLPIPRTVDPSLDPRRNQIRNRLAADTCHPHFPVFHHNLRAMMPHEELSDALAALVPDVFGPTPWRRISIPDPLDPALVALLADAAYRERVEVVGRPGLLVLDPVRLSVLADVLEEAGAEGEVVAHLRSPGPHVRGCWAVDAARGRG